MQPFILDSLIAGILASFACGLGALPLAFKGIDLRKQTGIAYSAAGGLMFAASVYNLILPGLTMESSSIHLSNALPVVFGGLEMCEDGHRPAQCHADIAFEILGNVMGIMHSHIAGDEDVHRDKLPRRGLARP